MFLQWHSSGSRLNGMWCWVGQVFPIVVRGLQKKQNNPSTGLDRPLGFQEVETPRFPDKQYKQVLSLSAVCTGCIYPLEIFLVLISIRCWVDLKALWFFKILGTICSLRASHLSRIGFSKYWMAIVWLLTRIIVQLSAVTFGLLWVLTNPYIQWVSSAVYCT